MHLYVSYIHWYVCMYIYVCFCGVSSLPQPQIRAEFPLLIPKHQLAMSYQPYLPSRFKKKVEICPVITICLARTIAAMLTYDNHEKTLVISLSSWWLPVLLLLFFHERSDSNSDELFLPITSLVAKVGNRVSVVQ